MSEQIKMENIQSIQKLLLLKKISAEAAEDFIAYILRDDE